MLIFSHNINYLLKFVQINIDFTLKYPNAKCLKDIWPQLGDAILNIIKNKCGGSLFFKELQKVESANEGKIKINYKFSKQIL